MVNESLRAFAARLRDKASISLADVQELRREILADGLNARDDADVLIALDRRIAHKDAAWEDCLVEALIEFVVWTSRPTGYVNAETADWLIKSLSGDGEPAQSAMRVAFEIVREAETVDEALLVFALRSTHRRVRLGAVPDFLATA